MKEESKLIELHKILIILSLVDEVDMVLYGATIIQEQEKYKPLIMQKFQHYKDNFDEEEHAEEIDYYLNFLEEPETLYIFTENIINLFKSFIK